MATGGSHCESDVLDTISHAAQKFGVTNKWRLCNTFALDSVWKAADVFVSLPTDYGKSMIYELLPAVFNKLKGEFVHLKC